MWTYVCDVLFCVVTPIMTPCNDPDETNHPYLRVVMSHIRSPTIFPSILFSHPLLFGIPVFQWRLLS
jgi:hypothetical protein